RQHLDATWVAAFLPARASGKIFSTHFSRVPTIPEKPARTMVNGDVMGTGFASYTLAKKRPARGMPSGLLAGRFLCCYCLDFNQLVYLFRLQW
ncbi:MAG: hypothetical protein WA764_16945, partial [Pseudolabrys sp.]